MKAHEMFNKHMVVRRTHILYVVMRSETQYHHWKSNFINHDSV